MLDTVAPPPPKPRKSHGRPYFTKANAAEFCQRGNAAKKAHLAALRAAVQSAASIPGDSYNTQRLNRVRVQLQRLDSELETCSLKDPKRVKGLAEAAAVLQEEERKLAGRPDPGKEGKRGARRDRPAGESMLDLGRVASPASEVSPAPLALPTPSSPSSTVCSTCPPSTPFRLPGDVTP